MNAANTLSSTSRNYEMVEMVSTKLQLYIELLPASTSRGMWPRSATSAQISPIKVLFRVQALNGKKGSGGLFDPVVNTK